MLISISDSVSCEVPGTEAVAAKGLCCDLNSEDLDRPFFLMGPPRKLKLCVYQVCLSVHFTAVGLTSCE